MAKATARSNPRRRLPGLTLKPGTVREAREAAGLSLSQLAGQEVTRGAIHLIENGLSRPSLPVLEAIASRTGRHLGFFADEAELLLARGLNRDEIERALARLEELYDRDHYEPLVEQAREFLTRVRGLDSELRFQYWLARGLTMLGRTGDASQAIDPVISRLAGGLDHLVLAEVFDCKGAILYLEHDQRAPEYFNRALDALDRLPTDPLRVRSKVLGHLGSWYVERHDFDNAIRVYTKAIEAAGAIRDLGRLALMYDDLSLAYQSMGDSSQALAYSQRSVAIHGQLSNDLSLANAHNNLGYLLLKQGDLNTAEYHLEASRAIYEATGVERKKSHLLLSLGELALRQHRLEDADSILFAASDLAKRLGEDSNIATADELMGEVAEARSDQTAADDHYRRAIARLRDLGLKERLMECHKAYGKILEARGDQNGAMRELKQALDVFRPDTSSSSTALEQIRRSAS